MECVQERSRPEHSATDTEINDSNKRKLDSLKLQLYEQEEIFENEEEGVERKKEAAKERAIQAFETLREVLEEKKSELLCKIDAEYSVATSFLAEFVSAIKTEKQKVSELITDCRNSTSDGKELDIEQLKNDIDANLVLRNDSLNQFHVPYLVINERSVETVKELTFAEFREPSASTTDQTHSNGESDADENIPEIADESSETDVIGNAQATGYSGVQEPCHVQEPELLGATGISPSALPITTPSAPPVDSDDAPPSYWQAIGLGGPQDVQDHRNFRLPKNKLEFWHSFRVLRQNGRRVPMPVALTWHKEMICIVDKANMRVEFFYPNGQLITELFFEDTELRDVAFLDETYNGGSRFIVLSPKSRTLTVIGVDNLDNARIFKKQKLLQKYLCICRGPRTQTLVGAEVSMTTGTPSVVYMFTLSGQILLTISHTPSYALWQYIKSVEVFGCHIIIMDWKMNLVAVFRDDGSAVGEYHGTEASPLINPSDMTLDKHGNVLILNGEFQNIHVIDLQCHHLEVIKVPSDTSPSTMARLTLIAFDVDGERLCVAKSNGDVAIFTFKNGYDCLPQGKFSPHLLLPHQNSTNKEHRAPEVLPLVEGMLPSTLNTILSRQSARNQNRQYNS